MDRQCMKPDENLVTAAGIPSDETALEPSLGQSRIHQPGHQGCHESIWDCHWEKPQKERAQPYRTRIVNSARWELWCLREGRVLQHCRMLEMGQVWAVLTRRKALGRREYFKWPSESEWDLEALQGDPLRQDHKGAWQPGAVTWLCTTLCDPIDCSPPGSSVHGILQARTLQWVAIPFSRGSS